MMPNKAAVGSKYAAHAEASMMPNKAAVESKYAAHAEASMMPNKAAVESKYAAHAEVYMMPNKAAVGSKYAAHAEATVEEQATILTEESPVVSGKLYCLCVGKIVEKSLADRIAWVLFPSARTTCEIAVASFSLRVDQEAKKAEGDDANLDIRSYYNKWTTNWLHL